MTAIVEPTGLSPATIVADNIAKKRAEPELRQIPLAEIHESPWNPRQTYDPAKLAELSESLKAGQLTPVLVRPRKTGGYELAAGHRRFRASPAAGLTSLLAIVREMDDHRFLEVLVIENDQRDDLHPLEEARGFSRLLKQGGYDIPKIAARIGRSTQYVYDRVKLLQLTKEAQKLFADGAMAAGHAILLARLSPEDQERAIASEKDNGYRLGGLFQTEMVEPATAKELELDDPRKPVSVREFQRWIDDNVRFRPEEQDLPNLFPATLEALQQASEAEEKVVKITRDYRVGDEARDEKERTFGSASWKRADGQTEPEWGTRKKIAGKTCEHAVLGVVVAGPGRGEAFKVCVAKKKCAIHWAQEQREAEKRAKGPTSNGKPDRWQEEERKRREKQEAQQKHDEAERARWKKAVPRLLSALVDKLKVAPAGADSVLAKLLLKEIRGRWRSGVDKHVPLGRTAEDLVRHVGFMIVAQTVEDSWNGFRNGPDVLKPFGVDAKKMIEAEDKANALVHELHTSGNPKSARTKRLAGDVRREKKAKAAKARKA